MQNIDTMWRTGRELPLMHNFIFPAYSLTCTCTVLVPITVSINFMQASNTKLSPTQATSCMLASTKRMFEQF